MAPTTPRPPASAQQTALETPADDALTGQERAVLTVLAAGVTQEAAATALGISNRTLRRRATSAAERLGVPSGTVITAVAVAASHGLIIPRPGEDWLPEVLEEARADYGPVDPPAPAPARGTPRSVHLGRGEALVWSREAREAARELMLGGHPAEESGEGDAA